MPPLGGPSFSIAGRGIRRLIGSTQLWARVQIPWGPAPILASPGDLAAELVATMTQFLADLPLPRNGPWPCPCPEPHLGARSTWLATGRMHFLQKMWLHGNLTPAS